MKSSNLFKMLVVAVALQASSNVFSMDLYGENSVKSLVTRYHSKSEEVSCLAAISLLKEMGDEISAHRQEAILMFFGKVKGKDYTAASLNCVFRQVRTQVAEKIPAAVQKSKAQRVAEFVRNNKKAIGGAVTVIAIGAAVYKREALKKAGADLYTKAANSSYVKSAMEKGSAVKASALAAGSSVYASASDKLASVGNAVKAKLPSMPTITMPKLSMPSMPKLSNPFAKSVATATVGAAASAVTQTATATTPVFEAVIPDVEPVAYAV